MSEQTLEQLIEQLRTLNQNLAKMATRPEALDLPQLIGAKEVAKRLDVSTRRAQQIIAALPHVLVRPPNAPEGVQPQKKITPDTLRAYIQAMTRNASVEPEAVPKKRGRPRKGVSI